MCGIVGIVGDLYYKDEKTMQSLLLLDYFRGTDSTGLASVSNAGVVKIAKLATDPITLFQFQKFKDALNGNASKLFLGHNRASTSGVTNNLNAHPYQYGHITGVQNGTLEYKDKTHLENELGDKYEVDSQALFASIDKFGVKETIEGIHEGFSGDRGAWALVWYNKQEDTINFLRNRHRPLWFAWSADFKQLFFASRWEMIHCATSMAEPEYKLAEFIFQDGEKKGQAYRFFRLPENQHWKFKIDEIKKGSKQLPKPIVEFIKGKEPIKSGGVTTTVWDPFQNRGSQPKVEYSSTTTSRRGSSDGHDREGLGIFHLFPECEDQPYTYALSISRFNELIQDYGKGQTGCSFCYANINFGDTGITVYDDQDTILCSKCSGYEGKEKNAPAAKIYLNRQHFAELKKAA